MLTDKNYTDLQEKGYTIVSDVLTPEECDTAIGQYRQWLSQFKEGAWPYSAHSLIQRYNTGHMTPTWFVRLKSKKVFAQIWQTDKLLSSYDAIAAGRPPEDGVEEFHRPGDNWLHLDQTPDRIGLHAYQGAVYLEEALEDDWTFHLLEGSHRHFEGFFDNFQRAAMKSLMNGIYYLKDEEIVYMRNRGCKDKRISVPKGGMVLWDSRLVHDNVRPIRERKHPGRWRFCVFVSMTPAIWASKKDLAKKKEAYEKAYMTTHWSSQGVNFFRREIPSFAPQFVAYPKELPEIAKTKEAKLIAGVLSYNYNDGNPTGSGYTPAWKIGSYGDESTLSWKHGLIGGLLSVVLAAGIGFAIFKLKR